MTDEQRKNIEEGMKAVIMLLLAVDAFSPPGEIDPAGLPTCPTCDAAVDRSLGELPVPEEIDPFWHMIDKRVPERVRWIGRAMIQHLYMSHHLTSIGERPWVN